MFPHPTRWDPTRTRPAARVDVYSAGVLLSDPAVGAPIIDGEVTDTAGTGQRRALSLTVPASWASWLQLPRLTIQPWRGLTWGPRNTFLCPLGVFPVDQPPRATPGRPITINTADYWSWITRDAYLGRPAVSDLARQVAADLIYEVGVGNPVVTATSTARLPSMVWDDKSRDEILKAQMDAIGAEAWFDRVGTPIIRDVTHDQGPDMVDGPGGLISTAEVTPDWSPVANIVIVSSSNAEGPRFSPVTVAISDPTHPADPSRIGPRTKEFSSPILENEDQARKAGLTILARSSAPVINWTTTGPVDPSKDAGDLAVIRCSLGTVLATAQEVRTPLTSRPQTITWGAAA